MKKLIKSVIAGMTMSMLVIVPVSAHVVVRPGEVQTSSYTTFTVSVPNEKQSATVGLRLEMPDNLSSVTPTVKPGWNIEIEKPDTAETDAHQGAVVTAITWTGGVIPEGQRDDFTFSAKTPDDSGELAWKAYQTYEDGTVVSWDKTDATQPKNADGSPDFTTDGPLSKTVVQSAVAAEDMSETDAGTDKTSDRAMYSAVAAVIVAFIALIISTRPKK